MKKKIDVDNFNEALSKYDFQEITGLRELSLFAGAGGGILGGKLLGWRTVCAVEIEPFQQEVLLHRQNTGELDCFPIWDDVSTFDGKPWRGIIDVVSGGFPCQDISIAGAGRGLDGERSGLWKEFSRIIREVRPKFAFVENSPLLRRRGLDRVLRDLDEIGYNAVWTVLGASDVGAPHKRERMWILATDREESDEIFDSTSERLEKIDYETRISCEEMRQTPEGKSCGADCKIPNKSDNGEFGNWWSSEPELDRMVDGVADRMDRLRSIGNGQVPIVAATVFSVLYKLSKRFIEK